MKFRFSNFLVLLLPYILIYVLGGLLSVPFIYFKTGDDSFDTFFKNVVFIPIIIFTIYLFKRKFSFIYQELIKYNSIVKQNLSFFFKGLLIGLLFLTLTSTIAYMCGGVKYDGLSVGQISLSHIIKDLVLVGLISNLLVCFAEEILFRVFLLNYLNQFTKNIWLPIVFSAMIFAIGHVNYTNIINTIIALSGGILFGYLYQSTKSLYWGLGIHFAYNLFNYTLTPASTAPNDLAYRPFFVSYTLIPGTSLGTMDVFTFLAFLLMLAMFIKTGKNAKLHEIGTTPC